MTTTRPSNPTQALETLEVLTGECARAMARIPRARIGRERTAAIARFEELNETRLRIVRQWRLETPAVAMVRRAVA